MGLAVDLMDSRTLLNIFQVAIVILIPLGVYLAVTIGRRRDLQRHYALVSLAETLGLPYTSEDQTILPVFGGFPFPPTGNAARAYSVMRGTMAGAPMVLFDYDVTIGTPNNRDILRRTVAAFDVTATPLPVFFLESGYQEKFTRVLDKVFGAEAGIEFPEDAEFALRYRVVGADVDAVRGVLGPAVRSLLKQRDWKCRSTGRWLLLSWLRDRPTPAEDRAFIEAASEARSLMLAR